MLALMLASFLAFESLPDHFIDNHPILEKSSWGQFVHDFDEKMGFIPYLPVWENLLYRKRFISTREAMYLVENDSSISYFFWVTGLVLRIEDSEHEEHDLIYGECLFFTGDLPSWREDRKGLLYYRTSEN
ncbi:MAG: hypothetical protein ChlgKO_09650 [Chlamydiales bacterium]